MSPRGEPAGRAPAGVEAPWRGTRAWTVEHLHGSVSDLFESEEPPPDTPRLARIHRVDGPGLVLGSTQKADTVDWHRAAIEGVEVLRRRSGGGAVLLWPGRQVWVDFFVPAGDPLWNDDVALAARWAGRLWSSVMAEFVAAPCSVHTGRLVADRWGRLVCFAGAGPGEVFVAGRKVVGVSQRRSRDRVRIQTAARLQPAGGGARATIADDGLNEVGLLDLTPAERSAGRAVLASRCGAVRAAEADLAEALVQALQGPR